MFYGNTSWIWRNEPNDKNMKVAECCRFFLHSLFSLSDRWSLNFFPLQHGKNTQSLNHNLCKVAYEYTIYVKWRLIGSLAGKPLKRLICYHTFCVTSSYTKQWKEGCNFIGRNDWCVCDHILEQWTERQLPIVYCIAVSAPKEKTIFINNPGETTHRNMTFKS